MTGRAWRLVRESHRESAFSGEGAAKAGGRWNSRGFRVIYASGSRALAALETLVHLNRSAPYRWLVFPLAFDPAWVEVIPPEKLPPDWRESPASNSTQGMGDRWVRERTAPILQVPSVIIPEEPNYLLNPVHPDFARIRMGSPDLFVFDQRLAR